MFEFVTGKEFIKNNCDYVVTGFDQKEGLFLAEDMDTQEVIKVNINDLTIDYHFSYVENWAAKLFDKLINTNKLHFNFWSMESADVWDFEIVRTETIINEYLTLVNYTIVFASDEIIGKVYTTILQEESIESFEKWFEEQMEEERVLNSYNCLYGGILNGIMLEDSMLKSEEVNFIYDTLDYL